MIFEKSAEMLLFKLRIAYERIEAHRLRQEVIKRKGRKVINNKLKKTIKQYSKERFGKSAYWPYLALYTEIRGEFIYGWIPFDYYRFILLPKINPKKYGYLSDHKTFDYSLFGEFAVKPLFLFISGLFFSFEMKFLSVGKVKERLADYGESIVIKEETGLGGKEVYILHSSDFDVTKLNKNKNYIIQPYIKQYERLSELYPESVNTFRVTTFLRNDGKIDIKFVILRFGINNSRVDNLTLGGQYLFIDAEGKPNEVIYDYPLGFEIGASHINTGFKFSNLSIPAYHDMIKECKNAHKKYPYLRLIGWDVCIDSNGKPKLIEWNAFNPVFWPQEALFGPFWEKDDDF
jgi:hypothetical protein